MCCACFLCWVLPGGCSGHLRLICGSLCCVTHSMPASVAAPGLFMKLQTWLACLMTCQECGWPPRCAAIWTPSVQAMPESFDDVDFKRCSHAAMPAQQAQMAPDHSSSCLPAPDSCERSLLFGAIRRCLLELAPCEISVGRPTPAVGFIGEISIGRLYDMGCIIAKVPTGGHTAQLPLLSEQLAPPCAAPSCQRPLYS